MHSTPKPRFFSQRWIALVLLATLGLNGSCTTASAEERQAVPQFAEDVLLHVVLHELGHALVREFDLPVLGNEETMADAFATYYLVTYLPNRAFDVLRARTQSLMIEASEVPRAEWTVKGEHNSDARRAYQIAAWAIAADSNRFRPIADALGMTDSDCAKAKDYGTEMHRSWRRVLTPLLMPQEMKSQEVRIWFDGSSPLSAELANRPIKTTISAALQRFDWHSQITVAFVQGDGGAGWNRSQRTVNVPDGYVQRFVDQSKLAK